MRASNETVTVTILGKEYQVACPEDEVNSLTQAARFLDQRMADIKVSGKVVGLDRIAVMAALNIAHEFLTGSHESSATSKSVNDRLGKLSERLEEALAEHRD